MVVRISGKPGRKVYIVGHRLHHGMTGCVLTAVGIYLLIHDRRDCRRWFKDLIRELEVGK